MHWSPACACMNTCVNAHLACIHAHKPTWTHTKKRKLHGTRGTTPVAVYWPLHTDGCTGTHVKTHKYTQVHTHTYRQRDTHIRKHTHHIHAHTSTHITHMHTQAHTLKIFFFYFNNEFYFVTGWQWCRMEVCSFQTLALLLRWWKNITSTLQSGP